MKYSNLKMARMWHGDLPAEPICSPVQKREENLLFKAQGLMQHHVLWFTQETRRNDPTSSSFNSGRYFSFSSIRLHAVFLMHWGAVFGFDHTCNLKLAPFLVIYSYNCTIVKSHRVLFTKLSHWFIQARIIDRDLRNAARFSSLSAWIFWGYICIHPQVIEAIKVSVLRCISQPIILVEFIRYGLWS